MFEPIPSLEISDEVLMSRFQAGDKESFRILFDRYATRLLSFAFRFLGSRQEAEDVVQETFLRIHGKKDRYDPCRSFRPWVFSIVSHLASNGRRSRRRHPSVSLDFRDGSDGELPREEALGLADPLEPSLLDGMMRRELAQTVRRAVDSLPGNQRAALLLAKFEGMSYEGIARTLGATVPAVESLLFRARSSLKKTLAPHLPSPRPH